MKRKLPKKKSSYKNLDLGEIWKTQNLLNSWTKYSLIGLLVAIFSNKQPLINFFDFQIATSLLSRDSHNLRSHKTFVLSTLFFVVLSVSIYLLGNKSIVERQFFGLRKIQKQTRRDKNYIDIYIKSFGDYNRKFDISLSKDLLFEKRKIYKNDLFDLNNCNSASRFHLQVEIEDLFSDYVYQFSNISSKALKASRRINFSNEIYNLNNNINSIESDYPNLNNEDEKNKSIHFVSFAQPPNTNEYGPQWVKRESYMGNTRLFIESVLIHPILANKFLLSLKKKPVPDFFKKFLVSGSGKYVMNNFLPQKTGSSYSEKSIFYSFLELLSIDGLNKNTENVGKNHYSKNHIESENIKIKNLCKIHKSYSNSWNYSFPFDPISNMVERTNYMNKLLRKKWNLLFLKFFHLFSSIFCEYKKLDMFLSCLRLGRDSTKINNKLYVLINEYNGIEYQYFNKIFPFLSQSCNISNSRDKSINDYVFIENKTIRYYFKFIEDSTQFITFNLYNLTQNNFDKYLKSLNNSYLKRHLSFASVNNKHKDIIHKYSLTWKKIIKRSFVRNSKDIVYKDLAFQVFRKIKELNIFYFSENFASHKFSVGIESYKFLNFDYQVLKDIKKFWNIFGTLVSSINFDEKTLFDRSERSMNRNSIISYRFDAVNIKNSSAELLIGEITNELPMELLPIFCYKINFPILVNYLRNIQSNYNKRFSSHSEKSNGKNIAIYPQFFKIFLGCVESSPIVNKAKSFSTREKIVPVAQSQLLNALFSGTICQNKTKLSFFPDFYKKIKNTKTIFFSNSLHVFPFEEQTKNTESFLYYRYIPENKTSFREYLSQNFWTTRLGDTEIGAYYDMICLQSLIVNVRRNDKIFRSINRILFYFGSEYHDSKYKIENKILGGRRKFQYNKFQEFKILGRFFKYISFINYTSWFFTIEWWEYYLYILVQRFQEIFLIISYRFEYFIGENIQIIQKNFVNLWDKNYSNLNSKWNLRLSVDYERKTIINFVWSNFELLNNWNSLRWAFFTLVGFVFIFHKNYFSILIGSDSIESWKNFETIRYLTDSSRASYFSKLMHRNDTQLDRAKNIVIYFFLNLTHHTRNIQFYLLTKKKLGRWLISNKSLDLSRRKRNLLVQSLIAHTRIKEYGFGFYPKQQFLNDQFGYRVTHQQGLLYFRHLAEILKKELVNYPLNLADKWIFFASLQKIIFPRASCQVNQVKKFEPGFQKVPVPLQFGLSRSKGVLLIGPVEAGRSYLIKNLAADSHVPLLRISINKLLYNKPDAVTESWVNILIESLRRLNLTLNLAKKMSPCIIWIQNIHQLNVDRSTQNVESDPTFLLGILLKHFQTDSVEARTENNTIVIGSTHVPQRVDPALISPNRLDRIINIRLFNNFQRRNQFTILLNKNNFGLGRNISYLSEFGFRTMGYNIRDLVALANEVSLISVTRNRSLIYTDIMKLAFHRQVFGFTYTNNKPKFKQIFGILLYKIGRAVIQNMLIKGSSTNPLDTSNYSWKKKFYYLSKWYLESPMNESITNEFTILTHVLGCLAGAAARDSWVLLEKELDIPISLDKLVENDFDLASSISESLFMEFSWLETCQAKLVNYKGEEVTLPTHNSLNIMQNGIFAIANRGITHIKNDFEYQSSVSQRRFSNDKNQEFRNIAWSPRFWRLSFLRSHSFDWIKRPNDLGFSKKRKCSVGTNYYNQLMGNKKEQLPYERILPRVRERNVQELEYQFEHILSEEQSEILGFSDSSTQYHIEYQLYNKPRLFIGKRILWDPIGLLLQMRHFVFSRRGFFADEEMLRRLYVTYGARRERERSRSNQKIKQFFLCRGYNKDLIAKFSVRWWNQLSMDDKQSINTLKQIEQIGIQLKRPQIFTPVYLYQRWLIENLPEKLLRFELLIHQQRWIRTTNSLSNDSLTYIILLESYQYLLRFFLSNKFLLNRMMKILLKKGWLFQNEIEDLINNKK
uniref:Hypothetical chloroplast RF21 n=1 Tax=Apopellia endiviifolia TaxID=304445 RepID=K4JUG2_9MARC|nr:hypothetical chloroplast RF21 [Apopellia endiviifolia]AFU88842.1 hypothetical chloroplast RF21 [Apopellia endiviifolia]WIA67725.1 hypothetical chloroplast RF21 [Apopellia endiviifolia]WKW94934.1 hypothetical chloroplast RF21 [Apopellia endiviifolia]